MTLTLNLVTRGRPERLLHVVKETASKISRDDTTYMISVDDDDTPTLDIADQLKSIDQRVLVNIKPREDAIGEKWSRVLEVRADVYMGQADYRAPATPGFDQKVLDAAALFDDGIGGVYTHMDNASFPTAQALTHGLVEKLGYYYPGIYPYWFVDHHTDDILKLIGRVAFADTSWDMVGRKPQTHEQREVPFWATFFDCQRIQRRRTARAIILSPEFHETNGRRQILLDHHPLIEYRSQWINDTVREMFCAAPQNADTGGERYARVKALAVAQMRELVPELMTEIGAAA